MTARERLDKRYAEVTILSGERATCQDVKSQIANHMTTTDKEGSKYTDNTGGLLFVDFRGLSKLSNFVEKI